MRCQGWLNRPPGQIHLARVVALVDEADVHLPTMTVEDTLRFAYKCNSKMGKDQHVQTIMKVRTPRYCGTPPRLTNIVSFFILAGETAG